MNVIRLPAMFFNDHKWRDLPTPEVLRENKRSVWIRTDDPNVAELLNDAQYYADDQGFDDLTMTHAARRLLAAWAKQGVDTETLPQEG